MLAEASFDLQIRSSSTYPKHKVYTLALTWLCGESPILETQSAD